MSITDVLDKSHVLVMETIDDLPETQWDVPGACGDWSVKDIIAHLTAYEVLLRDALKTFAGSEPTAYLLAFAKDNQDHFNAAAVARHRYATAQQIEDDYNEAQMQTTSLLAQIPAGKAAQKGTVPWFGPDLSLAELVNDLYTHTREHCEQIKRFRERTRDGDVPI
jgi:uncharacterized protein (TIGR03083 family)